MKSLLVGLLAVGIACLGRPSFAEILTAPSGLGSVRAYPNPWRSDRHTGSFVTIDQMPTDGVATVRIFTIAGELVRSLSGTRGVQWDLRNESGQQVASGIYLYLVSINGEQRTGKIAVIR